MKSYSSKTLLSILAVSCSVLIVFSLSSCARKMTFATSSVVPAATGTVKIKKNKNDNYSIQVKIKHLAPADKLSPPRQVYVVWMQSENNPVRNIGMIKSTTGLFSKTLKGELNTVSTSKPTSFFITAEDNGNIRYPGNDVVLRTK